MSSPENPNPERAEESHQLIAPDVPSPCLVGIPPQDPKPAVPPPVENPIWSVWDVLLVAVVTFVAIVVLQILEAVAAHWVYPHDSLLDAAQKVALKPIVLIATQLMVYLPLFVSMILVVEGKYRVPFWRAIRWNWPKSPWIQLGVGVLLFLVVVLLEAVLPLPKDTPFEHLFDRPRDAYLLSLIAVTLAPLLEELFFHGLLYPTLARWTGVPLGITLTAIPFALLHAQQYGGAWAAVFIIFVVGMVCGTVRAATKSVGASFLVHAGYNGTEMLLAVLATHGFRHMGNSAIISSLSMPTSFPF